MRDVDILIEVRGKMRHFSRSSAVAALADREGLTRSGVSGQLTRAEKTPRAMLALTNWLSEHGGKSKAEIAIEEMVKKHRRTLAEGVRTRPNHYTAVFLSDIHFPTQNPRVLTLLMQIIDSLPNVRYISALNDALDYAKLSHFPERRRIKKQQLDDDASFTLDVYEVFLASLRAMHPQAQLVAITGNHDSRIATIGVDVGLMMTTQFSTMQRLADAGVLFTASMLEEDKSTFSPAPLTLWAHGYKASANAQTAAKTAYQHYKFTEGIDRDYTLITGHTHRAIDHRLKGGGRSIINGCVQSHPFYMKNAPQWDYGIVVTEVFGQDAVHTPIIIEGNEQKGFWAVYNGKIFRE